MSFHFYRGSILLIDCSLIFFDFSLNLFFTPLVSCLPRLYYPVGRSVMSELTDYQDMLAKANGDL